MEYVVLKDIDKLFLPGCNIKTDTVDGSLKAIYFFDEYTGNPICKLDWSDYSFKILVPAPPKKVPVFSIKARLAGVSTEEIVYNNADKDSRVQELANAGFAVEVEPMVEVHYPKCVELEPVQQEKKDADIPF